jgi:hypothetical protein
MLTEESENDSRQPRDLLNPLLDMRYLSTAQIWIIPWKTVSC